MEEAQPNMRILIVSNGYPPNSFGGVEVYSYDLARELYQRGHQVHVFHRVSDPSVPDYSIHSEEGEGIPILGVVNDYKNSISFRDLYADQVIHQIFSSLLDSFQPELVHFNHFLTLSVTLPHETARRGIPSLVMVHDYWPICQRVNLIDRWHRVCPGPHQGGNCPSCVFSSSGVSGGLGQFAKKLIPYRLRRRLRKLLRPVGDTTLHFNYDKHVFEVREKAFSDALTSTNKILVPSHFVRDMLVANDMGLGRIEVLPLGVGVEPNTRHQRMNSPLRFGYAGSVAPLKGLETLLRAFRAVSLDSIRLDIYGREDLHPEFSREMHEISGEDARISFHGSFSPDQRESVLETFDLFVLPSIWHETFSLVAREALRSGIPVIATRVGALQEVVHEGINGFLVPPGDVGALSDLIRSIGEQPDLLSSLEVPGPVEIFSVPEHADRIQSMYHQICMEAKG